MFENISEKQVYKNLINGEWIMSSENLIEIKSPLDNSLVGKVSGMSQSQVDEVMFIAKTSQKTWQEVPLTKRGDILLKAADLLEENAGKIADVMLYEICKDRKGGIGEVKRTADLIRATVASMGILEGESLVGDGFPGFTKNKMAMIIREPLGIVLAISPFNYPINLAASKIAPALLAGNTVVFKPATQGVISAMHMVRVFEEAGLPAGTLNTVTGYGKEIGDYLVSHKRINFINFTGSTEVGEKIAQLAGMKGLIMELGGKDAAIVLEDANLELAADNIVAGAFSYSGQRCTAVKRILALESIADELVALIKERINKLKVGNPIEQDVTIVPLIDSRTADFVMELIQDAMEKGGTLVTGGDRESNLIYPTLIDNVDLTMRLAWEEPFGPVLPVIRVENVGKAINIANQSEYGLQSSVFTNSIDAAFYVATRLDVGSVQINGKTERGPDTFPFAGVKSSGIGVQGVKYALEAMTRPKGIVFNLKE